MKQVAFWPPGVFLRPCRHLTSIAEALALMLLHSPVIPVRKAWCCVTSLGFIFPNCKMSLTENSCEGLITHRKHLVQCLSQSKHSISNSEYRVSCLVGDLSCILLNVVVTKISIPPCYLLETHERTLWFSLTESLQAGANLLKHLFISIKVTPHTFLNLELKSEAAVIALSYTRHK